MTPEGTMPDDRGMSPGLLQQLTLAILDHSAEEGLRMIATVRSYLDTWEVFLQDRHELVDHLRAAHHADPACTQADPASLNRQHWHAHGSDLTSFLDAHPVQG
ncbi:MAG TPA: hypothetical protein VFO47_12240 [Actinomycetes bacterium]|nr:hypothetical protein [Actinomycetes bacterium]